MANDGTQSANCKLVAANGKVYGSRRPPKAPRLRLEDISERRTSKHVKKKMEQQNSNGFRDILEAEIRRLNPTKLDAEGRQVAPGHFVKELDGLLRFSRQQNPPPLGAYRETVHRNAAMASTSTALGHRAAPYASAERPSYGVRREDIKPELQVGEPQEKILYDFFDGANKGRQLNDAGPSYDRRVGLEPKRRSPERSFSPADPPTPVKDPFEAFPWMRDPKPHRSPSPPAAPRPHFNPAHIRSQGHYSNERPAYQPTPISELQNRRRRSPSSGDDIEVIGEKTRARLSPISSLSMVSGPPLEGDGRSRQTRHENVRSGHRDDDRGDYRQREDISRHRVRDGHDDRAHGHGDSRDRRDDRERAGHSDTRDRESGSHDERAFRSETVEPCRFVQEGCPIRVQQSKLMGHEMKCLYNPENAGELCRGCGLVTGHNHSCVDALKRELFEERNLTSNLMLINGLANRREPVINFVDVYLLQKGPGRSERIRPLPNDTVDTILQQAIRRLNYRLPRGEQPKKWTDYQLLMQGVGKLANGLFEDTTFFLPQFPKLLLAPIKMEIKIRVVRMYYDDEPHAVPLPPDGLLVPMDADPAQSVASVKAVIASKIPILWSRHELVFRGDKMEDWQLLFAARVYEHDVLELVARRHPQHRVR